MTGKEGAPRNDKLKKAPRNPGSGSKKLVVAEGKLAMHRGYFLHQPDVPVQYISPPE